jgi:mono/diheme cytochrome c family protein/5-hydroxyisourate hydrolase-like protein (transthyretin family)
MRKLIALLLVSLLTLTACLVVARTTRAAPPAQTPETTPSTAGGQLLWTENCLPCHGPAGHGDGPTSQSIPEPLPDMSNLETARQYVPAENFNTIKNGRMDKLMPPWGNQLNDAQIWDAAAYVWSLSTSAQSIAAGETIYAEQCLACHGADGNGDTPDAPADINDFTDLAVMSQLSQADLFAAYNATDQHAGLDALVEDDIWVSLDYVRTFSFSVPKRDGILTGQVLNAATGAPVGNIEVVLHAFQNNAKIESISGQADENGNYEFDNLSTEHSIMYVVEGLYQDVGYISQDSGMFMPESNEAALNLEVYDTTTDDSAVNVTQLHYLLSFSPNTVNVLQIFIVGNSGDKTVVGQDGQTFRFSLPDNAANVIFQNDPAGVRFVETGTGYADTSPVLPGEEGLTIAAIYDIPFSGDSMDIGLPLSTPTGSLDVLMTRQGATLSSDQIDFIEDRAFQGNEFAVFNGRDFAAGEVINLKLTGLNDIEVAMPGNEMATVSTGATWFTQEWAKWTLIGLGLVAVVVAVVIYPRARPQLTHQTTAVQEDNETRRQRLLLTLARLDETFQNGELDEAVYRRARARYKAELAQLMEQA